MISNFLLRTRVRLYIRGLIVFFVTIWSVIYIEMHSSVYFFVEIFNGPNFGKNRNSINYIKEKIYLHDFPTINPSLPGSVEYDIAYDNLQSIFCRNSWLWSIYEMLLPFTMVYLTISSGEAIWNNRDSIYLVWISVFVLNFVNESCGCKGVCLEILLRKGK